VEPDRVGGSRGARSGGLGVRGEPDLATTLIQGDAALRAASRMVAPVDDDLPRSSIRSTPFRDRRASRRRSVGDPRDAFTGKVPTPADVDAALTMGIVLRALPLRSAVPRSSGSSRWARPCGLPCASLRGTGHLRAPRRRRHRVRRRGGVARASPDRTTRPRSCSPDARSTRTTSRVRTRASPRWIQPACPRRPTGFYAAAAPTRSAGPTTRPRPFVGGRRSSDERFRVGLESLPIAAPVP